MNRKRHLLFRIAFSVAMLCLFSTVMTSCHKNEKNDNGFITDIDIAQIAKDYENYNPSEGDTTTFPADCKRLIQYWKQPCLELAPDVEHYLDSIEKITGIPDWKEDDGIAETVHHAVHELHRYQTGERGYYPDKEVKDAIAAMFAGFSAAYGHAYEDYWYITAHYFHCFAAQASLLSPSVEFISQTHSEDHQVGLLNYSTNAGPFLTSLIHKRGDRCTYQLVDLDMVSDKVFQIREKDKDYYLLTSYDLPWLPTVYLYEKQNDDLYLAVRYSIPYSDLANDIETGDDAKIIYNPKKRQWDLCVQNGEYWYKIEGTKSCFLLLDKSTPYFEVR